jgi:hypothetical protein
MNTLETPSTFSNIIPQRAALPIDFRIVCLWATLGLVLTALTVTLGFGAEVAQALALAG